MNPKSLVSTIAIALTLGAPIVAQDRHWAYVRPERPAIPEVREAAWPKNAIDDFVLARLERKGFHHAPEASRERLLRRVYLDLIGLPPSVDEIDAFLADARPDAYERVVDTLLASPRYGEHWARHWLDLARYADSNGFQADQLRESWAYRDWVIDAFNADMPFDRFTIEQLAGDLLPNPTLAQRIATGFHRTVTCNVEAGVHPEENRVNQVLDRVNTTGTVWLGTTIGCAQCHDHKYDPFSQTDYYRLFAFFNNTPIEVENPLGNKGVRFDFYGPKLELPLTDEQRRDRAELERRRAKLDAAYRDQLACVAARPDLPPRIRRVLGSKKRNKKQVRQVDAYLSKHEPTASKLAREIAKLDKRIRRLDPHTTLVMVEMDEPRTTHVLERGNYLRPREAVEAGTPAALSPWNDSWPKNRLGLARWIVDPANPLTARVTVNRWWSQFFGHGIVRTEEDFGTQCEPPTHPKLLDWLAVELVESGWSMKRLHKRIVMSATYRQSSRITAAEQAEMDPDNLWYARGPRFRMSAEMIRDCGLAISGLLSTKMGGPPVYPPQPAGLWRQTGRNEPKYVASTGEDRFRRGIYVIWRRAAPYPSFVNFDGPDRSACHPKRSRTNTPMQALTLLNDEAWVEMALGLAQRVLVERPKAAVDERIVYAFRLCTGRRPSDKEIGILRRVVQRESRRLTPDRRAAKAIVEGTAGFRPRAGVDRGELATWFFAANVLLNLDETITKG